MGLGDFFDFLGDARERVPLEKLLSFLASVDVDQDERGDREVERVDDPAEKDRPESSPLISRDLRVPRDRGRLEADGCARGHESPDYHDH